MKRAPLNLSYRRPSALTITHSLHVQECHPSFPIFSLHVAVHLIWDSDIRTSRLLNFLLPTQHTCCCLASWPALLGKPSYSPVILLDNPWAPFPPSSGFHMTNKELEFVMLRHCPRIRQTTQVACSLNHMCMYVRKCVCVWFRGCACSSGITGCSILSVRDEHVWCHWCTYTYR